MTAAPPPSSFRERLAPGPWMFVGLLLLVPAVMLVMTPLNPELAVPVAVVLYLLFAASLMLLAPVVTVADGVLTAGRAHIPVAQLGAVEVLGDRSLRDAIGPGADARAYLMVRGYIHGGIRVAVSDPADPAPYWVITTRRPQTLKAAIEAARA